MKSVCCCKLNYRRDCDEHLFGQVSTRTGRYQLLVFRCTNVHPWRYARPQLRGTVFWLCHGLKLALTFFSRFRMECPRAVVSSRDDVRNFGLLATRDGRRKVSRRKSWSVVARRSLLRISGRKTSIRDWIASSKKSDLGNPKSGFQIQ